MTNVATFYKFVHLEAPEEVRAWLHEVGASLALKGTVLLADEGINGTLTGRRVDLAAFLAALQQDVRFENLPVRHSTAPPDNPLFYRLKIRVKPEIVSFGQPEVDPGVATGEHVTAERWHDLLDDPDVLVIDTRNDYEVSIGTFPGSLNPETTNFREFVDFVDRHLDPGEHTRVAMCCTGGIRCEKASAYLLGKGFEAVYQLEGGILEYLRSVDREDNRWVGECFVFDQRVSVDYDLRQGSFEQCFACRHPLSSKDLQSARYQQGVACPHCFDHTDDEQRAGYRERQRQVTLADARGELHIGTPQNRC